MPLKSSEIRAYLTALLPPVVTHDYLATGKVGPWIVGIPDPRNRDKQAVVLPLSDTALSTSGDYERFFEEDGRRYHHILSPKSGKSVYEVQSVSILGPSSTFNDAYSTAVFVLGIHKGIEFINKIPDYDVIIMDNQRKMHYSDGLEAGE